MEITDNGIVQTTHFTHLGTKWTTVIIENNCVVNPSGKDMAQAFMLNGEGKNASYDEGRVQVRGNVVKDGVVKEIVTFSGHKAAPQLKRVKNVMK